MTRLSSSERPRGWGMVGQVAFSLAVLAAMVPWALLALLLVALRCDENCSGDQYDYWGYPGQALLSAVGLAAAAVSLVLGFTGRRTAFWTTFLVAAVVAAVWGAWISAGSF